MPWTGNTIMDERLRFVARLLEGEQMSFLCREFGISRKTGYKIFDRYKDCGLEGLTDRSRRPVRYANQLPPQLEAQIVELKRSKPHWGARKIRELLVRRLAGDVRVPAKSTIHAVLDRHDLVKRMGRRRHRATGTPLSLGQAPNQLWCVDYKGEFKLVHQHYCYPFSPTSSPARGSASRKSKTAFGSSPPCTMISVKSIWSRGPCSPSTTLSAKGVTYVSGTNRHPCLRVGSSWMVPARGIEPRTY